MSSRSITVAQIDGNISAAARSSSGKRPAASSRRTSLWRSTATRPVAAGNPPANPRGGIRSQWLWAMPRIWPVDHTTVASVMPMPPRTAPGPPESVDQSAVEHEHRLLRLEHLDVRHPGSLHCLGPVAVEAVARALCATADADGRREKHADRRPAELVVTRRKSSTGPRSVALRRHARASSGASLSEQICEMMSLNARPARNPPPTCDSDTGAGGSGLTTVPGGPEVKLDVAPDALVHRYVEREHAEQRPHQAADHAAGVPTTGASICGIAVEGDSHAVPL